MPFPREQDVISNTVYQNLVQHFEAHIYGDIATFEKSLLSFDQAAEAIIGPKAMKENQQEKREKEEKERATIVTGATFEMSSRIE